MINKKTMTLWVLSLLAFTLEYTGLTELVEYPRGDGHTITS